MSRWNSGYNNNNRHDNGRQRDCDNKRSCDCGCQEDPCMDECYCDRSNCPPGAQGPAGGVLDYADLYALMPPDNTATAAPGTDVSFPQDGPDSGADIFRAGPDSFNLTQIG